MRWQVEYGARVPLMEKMAESGETPAALMTKPELVTHAVPYFNAFQRLRACSSADMPIPFADIAAYAKMFCYNTLDQRAELFRYVNACDRVLRERANEPGERPTRRR